MALTLVEEWAAANRQSARLHERARAVLPDGVTQDVRLTEPFPVSIRRADGSRKWDADGHELVCYVMGHGSLLFGHGDRHVVDAVQRQARAALHPGSSHEAESAWAEQVVRLVPSAERVRFTSSGTEATFLALRIARAYTQRSHVVKIASHFHGWHDYLVMASDPPFDQLPTGVPEEIGQLVHAVPPDAGALEDALRTHPVAAVILEPSGALSGAVPMNCAFLSDAAEVTRRYGAVLVFDEVVTGFRWAPGGAQEKHGVLPDLSALGKILSGGMPGGCVAGSREVMSVLEVRSPRGKARHTGTHNAHPLSAVAGIATLRRLGNGAAQAGAAAHAATLRDQLNSVLRTRGISGFVYGESSHFCVLLGHPRPEVPEHELPDVVGLDVMRRGLTGPVSDGLHAGMLLRGVQLFHGHGFASTAHTEADLEQTVDAFSWSLDRMFQEGLLVDMPRAPTI